MGEGTSFSDSPTLICGRKHGRSTMTTSRRITLMESLRLMPSHHSTGIWQWFVGMWSFLCPLVCRCLPDLKEDQKTMRLFPIVIIPAGQDRIVKHRDRALNGM